MARSKTYTFCACTFAMAAAAVIARQQLLVGSLMVLAAIAFALRARSEWRREQRKT
jgi:hypothetical protein